MQPRLLYFVLVLLSLFTCPCLMPASEPPKIIKVLDLRFIRNMDIRKPDEARQVWDNLHFISALQGLVNRQGPLLYIYYCQSHGVETDEFWLNWLRDKDGWLKNFTIEKLASIEEAVAVFRNQYQGLVVYDEAVPATSNVASTAAGCEQLLPVRYSTNAHSPFSLLYQKMKIPVKLWLVNPDGTSKFTPTAKAQLIGGTALPSTGSNKNDAYRWAISKFLLSGKCDPGFAAYYLDAYWLRKPTQGPADLHTLSNHDYFISKRAFFFDHSCWADEVPNDDPTQPLGSDLQMLKEILGTLAIQSTNKMIKIGGFTPWPYKYTDHHGVGGKHGGVETEWEFSRIVSQYNAYVEADAAGLSAIANASFYQHYPLKKSYAQPNPKPTKKEWQASGYLNADGKVKPQLYLGHYVGDYDAPSWLYKTLPVWFSDKQHGKVPLGWAFNPNLADRIPQAMVYAYVNASKNDYFIAGDSGAGYVNPRALVHRPDSSLPSGLSLWREHCDRYYRQWGITITGFVLDGAAGASGESEYAAYRTFSPDGCGTHFEKGPRIISGIPTCPEKDLPDDAKKAAAVICAEAQKVTQKPRFLWARSILKSPSWYAEVEQLVQQKTDQVTTVDPYTFFGLIQEHITNAN